MRGFILAEASPLAWAVPRPGPLLISSSSSSLSESGESTLYCLQIAPPPPAPIPEVGMPNPAGGPPPPWAGVWFGLDPPSKGCGRWADAAFPLGWGCDLCWTFESNGNV